MTVPIFKRSDIDLFLDWLSAEGYVQIELTDDGRWVGVKPLLFHWTMNVGQVFDDVGYDDRFCYVDRVLSEHALAEWKARSFSGEPIGWHRHPQTGRRRPDGDITKEYVEH